MAKRAEYGKLTWEELKSSAGKPAILVFGATEAHGRHMPLDTDTLIPNEIALRVAEKTGALVLPAVPYGHCHSLSVFPGTINIRPDVLESLARELVSETVRNGFRKILILNGHGGNAAPIKNALKELSGKLEFRACVVSWWEMPELEQELGPTGHADSSEASLYMFFAQGVKPAKARQEKSSRYFGSVFPMPKDIFTPSGYVGDVKNINKARGNRMSEIIVAKLVKVVKAGMLLKEAK